MALRLAGPRIWTSLWLLVACAAATACSPASPVIKFDASVTGVNTDRSAPQVQARSPVAAAEATLAASGVTVAEAEAAIGRKPAAIPASATNFPVSTILTPDRPLGPGDYLWEGEGVAGGPTRIVVDIEAQLLYVYRGEVEIGRSFIIYGHDDKPTPTGVFPILEKDADHVSNLYDAPMPYMLRLTWDGVAIHGSEVDARYATHGCIGIPDEFAEILFRAVKLGDTVLVTNKWLPNTYAADLHKAVT